MSEYTGTDNLEVMAEAINYNSFLLSLIRQQLRPGMRILDIGAGIGTFAKQLLDEGYSIVCFEPDPVQAQRIELTGLPVVTSMADIASSEFDFIYSLNVLEHIEDDQGALKQWFRLLKPGAKILVYVPAFQVLFSSMDKKVGHFRRYTRGDLARLADVAGGVSIRTRYVDSLGFFASLVYKFTNRAGDIHIGSLKIYDRLIFPLSRMLDLVVFRLLGKNVYFVAQRRRGSLG